MITAVASPAEFEAQLASAGSALVTVHFWASWAAQCAQMNTVLGELSKLHPGVRFLTVEAESVPDLSLRFNVSAVPTFVFLKGSKVLEQMNGADAARLTELVARLADTPAPATAAPAASSGDALNSRLRTLINAAQVMVFIKGTADAPQCGFSNQIIQLLRTAGAEFSTFNILADEEVRQGLKTFSNWPTYPQLYIKGELIGGLDIVKELVETNQIADLLPKKAAPEDLNSRLHALINKSPVMLFMKGSPDEPRCGFSNTIVGILRDNGVQFGYYDILGDEEVRQGLKTYSNWPTYPQLYSKGQLIGGLDIVKELVASNELKSALDS